MSDDANVGSGVPVIFERTLPVSEAISSETTTRPEPQLKPQLLPWAICQQPSKEDYDRTRVLPSGEIVTDHYGFRYVFNYTFEDLSKTEYLSLMALVGRMKREKNKEWYLAPFKSHPQNSCKVRVASDDFPPKFNLDCYSKGHIVNIEFQSVDLLEREFVYDTILSVYNDINTSYSATDLNLHYAHAIPPESFDNTTNCGIPPAWTLEGAPRVFRSGSERARLRMSALEGAISECRNLEDISSQASFVTDTSNVMELVARWSNDSNYYGLQLNTHAKTLKLQKTINGVVSTLATKTGLSITTGNWITLRLVVNGTSLYGYYVSDTGDMNSNVEITATTTGRTTGKVGVRGRGGTVDVTDIDWCDLDGGLPFYASTDKVCYYANLPKYRLWFTDPAITAQIS